MANDSPRQLTDVETEFIRSSLPPAPTIVVVGAGELADELGRRWPEVFCRRWRSSPAPVEIVVVCMSPEALDEAAALARQAGLGRVHAYTVGAAAELREAARRAGWIVTGSCRFFWYDDSGRPPIDRRSGIDRLTRGQLLTLQPADDEATLRRLEDRVSELESELDAVAELQVTFARLIASEKTRASRLAELEETVRGTVRDQQRRGIWGRWWPRKRSGDHVPP